MSNQNTNNPKMPIGGVFTIGQAQSKPNESSVVKYGDDLRNGGGNGKK